MVWRFKIVLHTQPIKTFRTATSINDFNLCGPNMAIQNVLIGCVCKTVLNCQPTISKLFEQELSLIVLGWRCKTVFHTQPIKTFRIATSINDFNLCGPNMAIQNVLIGCVCKVVLDCQPIIIKLFEQCLWNFDDNKVCNNNWIC